MKKLTLILILFCSMVIYSCKETPCDVKDDINGLNKARTELYNDVQDLGNAKAMKMHEIDSLVAKLKIVNIHVSGRTPRYILKLHLKQSHITLNVGKYIKDAMNAIDFELPVDKDFYDQVQVNTEIVDKFRSGSLWIEGSFGNWKMTVTGKEIR
jgi:hypothetical protein